MGSMKKRRSAVLVLLIATLAVGCELTTSPSPQDRLEAEAPDQLLGGLLSGGSLESTLDLVESTNSLLVEQITYLLVGPDDEATLELLGHSLTIEAGAVEAPTYFVMIVLPGNSVQVELFAIDAATGLSVGEKGFQIPVQLALSYASVSGIKDPSKLVIAHLTSDGGKVALETTVDEEAQTASASLDHFSRYALCRN